MALAGITQPNAFHFVIGLNRAFDPAENITLIVYPVGSRGEFDDELSLEDPVSEETAVKLAETILSERLTPAYFKRVKEDTDWAAADWASARNELHVRGELLGGRNILRKLRHDGDTLELIAEKALPDRPSKSPHPLPPAAAACAHSVGNV